MAVNVASTSKKTRWVRVQIFTTTLIRDGATEVEPASEVTMLADMPRPSVFDWAVGREGGG